MRLKLSVRLKLVLAVAGGAVGEEGGCKEASRKELRAVILNCALKIDSAVDIECAIEIDRLKLTVR